jgi:MFS transporter, DHA1 family, tetracycline resistance protein
MTSRTKAAGLVGSSSALALMLGPLVGTGLYEFAPAAPYLFGTALLVGLAVFAFAHPGIRRTTAEQPSPAMAGER